MKLVLAFLAIACALAAYPQIPGADMVGHGFDAVYLEHRPLPIFKQTYTEGNTWQNPIYPSYQYSVPDQIIVQDDIQSLLVNGSLYFSDVSDYQKQIVKTDSSSGFLGFGAHSKTTVDYYHKYNEYDYTLALSYQFHAWYQLTSPPLPPPTLHPTTQSIIDALPDKYNKDNTTAEYQAYREFIDDFGTHYISKAVMGGTMKATHWFNKCLLTTFSGDWVTEQSGWSFLGIISDEKGSKKYNGKLSALWKQNSVSVVTLEGGKSVVFDPKDAGWDEWVPSIKDSPAIVDYDTELISTLVTDSNKASQLEAAIKDYMKEAYEWGQALQESLVPSNPYVPPSWCKT